MSHSFVKLFNSITESTVWVLPDPLRILWITMLAMSDRNGRVFGSIPGLASRARISLKDCEEGISLFLAPDPYSRTKEHDGRRIEEIDGGWKLINYAKYREMRDKDERRDYMREYMRKWRAVNKHVSAVSQNKPPLAQAEAEAEINTPPQTPPQGGIACGPDPEAVVLEACAEYLPAMKLSILQAGKWAETILPQCENGEFATLADGFFSAVARVGPEKPAAYIAKTIVNVRQFVAEQSQSEKPPGRKLGQAEGFDEEEHERFLAEVREQDRRMAEEKAKLDAQPKPTKERIEQLKRETVW